LLTVTFDYRRRVTFDPAATVQEAVSPAGRRVPADAAAGVRACGLGWWRKGVEASSWIDVPSPGAWPTSLNFAHQQYEYYRAKLLTFEEAACSASLW
jgi:hypothetical protein